MRTTTFALGALALPLLAPVAAPQGAAQFLPQDAVVKVHIPNLGKTIDGVRNAAETVCAHPMLNQGLQEGLQEIAREMGFNPLQKNTWRALGIDVSRDAALFVHLPEESDFEPLFAFVVPVSDAEALKGSIAALMGKNRKMEWREAAGFEGAVQPWVESWDGESMRAEDMIFAVRDGYAVLCGSDDSERLGEAARLALGGGGGLEGDTVFAEARQSLGERDVYASIRIASLMDGIRRGSQRSAEEWRRRAAESEEENEWMTDVAESMDEEGQQMQWVSDLLEGFGEQLVLGLSADETGVRIGSWMKGANMAELARPRATHPALDAILQPNAMALLRYSINPNALEEMFLGMPESMREEVDLDEVESGLEMVNGMLGVDLIEDVWRQWSGRIQLSIGAPDESLNERIADAIQQEDMSEETIMGLVAETDLTLAIEFLDAAGASTLVEQGLALLGESAPVIVDSREFEGGRVWSVAPDMGGDPVQLGAAAIVHQTLVLGTARGVESALERIAARAEPQVADPAIAKALGQASATAGYLDIKPIHRLVKTLSDSVQEEELAIAEGVLMTLDSVSLWSLAKGEVGRSELVVSFR